MSNAFKDSPRERVRVANGLTRAYRRYYHNPNRTVSSALFSICILQTCGDASQGDTLLNLADLIDPTCRIVRRRNASVTSGVFFEYDLSCGHTVNDIDGEPPTYCPVCGRRLVESDAPEADSGQSEADLGPNGSKGDEAILASSEGKGSDAAACEQEGREETIPQTESAQQVQAPTTTTAAEAGPNDSPDGRNAKEPLTTAAVQMGPNSSPARTTATQTVPNSSPATTEAASEGVSGAASLDETSDATGDGPFEAAGERPHVATPFVATNGSASIPDDPAANDVDGSAYPNPYTVRKAG